jgi:hypothetical protein
VYDAVTFWRISISEKTNDNEIVVIYKYTN